MNKLSGLFLGPDLLLKFGFCWVKEYFCITAYVSVPNYAFESLTCKKALREGIEYSDRRDSHNMWHRL